MTFPPSQGNVGVQATTYGPLPDHIATIGNSRLAVVYHTTETVSVPSYGGGKTAPHYTYEARDRTWWQHEPSCSKRVGTMKGFSSTGVYANDKSIQVEIVCYSDQGVASGSPSRIWVGDLTSQNLDDLAEFYTWSRENFDVGNEFYGPPMFGSWRYGTNSPVRLSKDDWYAFSGLTAHGAPTGQTHWDTGVLDLGEVWQRSQGDTPGGGMFPIERGDDGEDVRWVQHQLRELGFYQGAQDGVYGEVTSNAVLAWEPDKNPDRITGVQGAKLTRDYVRAD